MGSSVPNGDEGDFDELPDLEPIEDPMGDQGNDKPFDDEPFDAGVEADEEDNPEKYIQQLSGKLGQSLRKYTEDLGAPDYDLEKFAINSVLSATNSGEMDQQDQSDIIQKVKSSTTDGTGKKDEDPAEAEPENNDDDTDTIPSDEPLDLDNIDMEESALEKKTLDDPHGFIDKKVTVDFRKEIGVVKSYDNTGVVIYYPDLGFKEKVNYHKVEVKFLPNQFVESHNPNGNGNTVFKDAFLGVNDDGMEENNYLTLESKNNYYKLNKMIKDMISEVFMGDDIEPMVEPQVEPQVEPKKEPKRETRRSKPWRPHVIPEQNPQPKANTNIEVIKVSEFSDDGNTVSITFDVDGKRFSGVNFNNNADEKNGESTYKSDILDNGKQYIFNVIKKGNLDGFNTPTFKDGKIPNIEEV